MAATVLCGITVEKNPLQSRLDELGVAKWAEWKSDNWPDKIRHTFKSNEYMYIFKGKVKLTVDGYEEEAFEINGGDLIIVPKGTTYEWHTIERVEKAYLILPIVRENIAAEVEVDHH